MSIADNYHLVRERIAAAAAAAGRDPREITLVGITKYVGPREAAELVAAGCHDLGESRPQELWTKYDALEKGNGILFRREGQATDESIVAKENPVPFFIRWHFVGHLQRNKVARTVPLVVLIHSVDSERLLVAINDARAEAAGGTVVPLDVLLEVNTSGESAKHGLAPDDVEPLLAAAPQFPHVRIRGLMTMAALEGGPDVAARNFATLRELRDRLRPNVPECVKLDDLSMGMSGDFEIAIHEGATIVRVGSLLWEKSD